jgi:hypothetical protein
VDIGDSPKVTSTEARWRWAPYNPKQPSPHFSFASSPYHRTSKRPMSKNKLHRPDAPLRDRIVTDVYVYPIRERPKPRLAVPLSEHLKAVEEHRRNVEARRPKPRG